MADLIMTDPRLHVKTFVPATDYDAGRKFYADGKRYAACSNDEQRRGWVAQAEQGRVQYRTAMATERAA